MELQEKRELFSALGFPKNDSKHLLTVFISFSFLPDYNTFNITDYASELEDSNLFSHQIV